jgi:hypothetical protein
MFLRLVLMALALKGRDLELLEDCGCRGEALAVGITWVATLRLPNMFWFWRRQGPRSWFELFVTYGEVGPRSGFAVVKRGEDSSLMETGEAEESGIENTPVASLRVLISPRSELR